MLSKYKIRKTKEEEEKREREEREKEDVLVKYLIGMPICILLITSMVGVIMTELIK